MCAAGTASSRRLLWRERQRLGTIELRVFHYSRAEPNPHNFVASLHHLTFSRYKYVVTIEEERAFPAVPSLRGVAVVLEGDWRRGWGLRRPGRRRILGRLLS